jgi:hypothetical protein
LHVTDEIGSLEDWEDKWAEPSSRIENEYGEAISVSEMLDIILTRGDGRWCAQGNELAGHPLGMYCVGNFGTYDLIPGVFS